jgi:hypothetical protein
MQKYLSNKNELCLQEEIQSISKSEINILGISHVFRHLFMVVLSVCL